MEVAFVLNARLRQFRELCDYSQQQVADCLNIDRSTYSYYESGRTEPSIDNLKKLASIFGVSILDLLEVDKPMVTMVRDESIYDEPVPTVRIGELTKEEQKLIMRFRMLTTAQRRDVMLSMCIADLSDESEDTE